MLVSERATGPDEKYCKGCDRNLPATEEYFRREGRVLAFYCRECTRRKSREAYWKAKRGETRPIDYSQPGVGDEAYRARKRQALLENAEGSFTKEDRIAQFARQKGKCYYCGRKLKKTSHIDHIVPLSRGGANRPENIVITCSRCNCSKNDKLPHEWPEGGYLL